MGLLSMIAEVFDREHEALVKAKRTRDARLNAHLITASYLHGKKGGGYEVGFILDDSKEVRVATYPDHGGAKSAAYAIADYYSVPVDL